MLGEDQIKVSVEYLDQDEWTPIKLQSTVLSSVSPWKDDMSVKGSTKVPLLREHTPSDVGSEDY